jgi:AcrR family transcriptional regulator
MARAPDPELLPKLMAASAAEFARKGFVDTTIEGITRRAGYSKAAFYLHFDTKEAAFRILLKHYVAGLENEIHNDDRFLALDPGPAAGPQVLAYFVDKAIRIAEYQWEHRDVTRMLVGGVMATETAPLIADIFERGRQRLERFFAWGIRQQIFRASVDPALASLLFAGAHERLAARIVLARSRPDIGGLIRAAHELLLDGLVVHDSPRSR